MKRQVLLVGVLVLVATGWVDVNDAEWHWCQGNIAAVEAAYLSGGEANSARIDWYFRQGDDSTRSNSYTIAACRVAYGAR